MQNWMKLNNCTLFWWVVAAIGGIAAFKTTNAATSFFVALLIGAAMLALIGFAMSRLFCQGTGAGVMSDSRFTGPAIGSDTPSIAKAAALAAMERRPVAYSPPCAKVFGTDKGAAAKQVSRNAAGSAATGGATGKGKVASQETPAAVVDTHAAQSEPTMKPDLVGDGLHDGAQEGTRPAALDAPREGKADNLKEIKGIGPKLEKLCHSMGFYHFDQIANWTSDEVAWVDANLQGFKGRVTRDNWISQARILAAGGETEFSKRVEDGNVY